MPDRIVQIPIDVAVAKTNIPKRPENFKISAIIRAITKIDRKV